MPNYENNIEHDNLRRPDWKLFLRAFRAALRRVKLWGATWAVLLLLSLVPALQTSAAMQSFVGNRYPTTDAARDLHTTMGAPTAGLTAVFRQDTPRRLGAARPIDQQRLAPSWRWSRCSSVSLRRAAGSKSRSSSRIVRRSAASASVAPATSGASCAWRS